MSTDWLLSKSHLRYRLSSSLFGLTKRFYQDSAASLAVTTAFLMLFLIGVSGAAIDFTMLSSLKVRIQTAADAATVTGSRSLLDYVSSNGSQTVALYYPVVQNQIQNSITANLQSEKNLSGVQLSTPSVSYTQSTGTVSVSITANYKPFLMSIFGIRSLPLSAASTSASSNQSKYYQVVFLVDYSQSMAVGGSVSDIQKTVNYFGCTFACHEAGSDTLTLGRSLGISFKIDYAKTAISNFMTQLQSISGPNTNAYYSAGIYMFSDHLQTLIAPNSNLSVVAAAANGIDVETLVTAPFGSTYGHTNLASALTNLSQTLPKLGGDGSSQNTPQTILVLVTDGAEDLIGNPQWAGQTDGNWGSSCTQFTNKSATVYAINTYYYPYTNDGGYYNIFVAPHASQIQSAFTNCVGSTSNVILASDGPGIITAVNQLFKKISGTLIRVSN